MKKPARRPSGPGLHARIARRGRASGNTVILRQLPGQVEDAPFDAPPQLIQLNYRYTGTLAPPRLVHSPNRTPPGRPPDRVSPLYQLLPG